MFGWIKRIFVRESSQPSAETVWVAHSYGGRTMRPPQTRPTQKQQRRRANRAARRARAKNR